MSTKGRKSAMPPSEHSAASAAPSAHAAAELARLRNALDCSLAGLWEWHVPSGQLHFDARAAALAESPDSHAAPTSLAAVELLMHPQDLERWQQRWRDHLTGVLDRLDCEVRLSRGPGRWAWVLWRGRVLTRTGSGQPDTVAGVLMDIHQRKEAEEQLSVMAQRDPLTELPNRALLADRLEHALASARRNRRTLVVMGVRLEGVQPINESLGQEMGHQVIKQAARRMATCTRASDSIARTGVDEFVLLLEDVEGTEDALAVADKLRHHVREPLVVDGHWLEVSASIGVAMYPLHGDNVFSLLEFAAQAAEAAARSGGNVVGLFKPSSESSPPTPTAG